jgi:hypothetical protein
MQGQRRRLLQGKIKRRYGEICNNNFHLINSWKIYDPNVLKLGLWCLMPLSTIFQLYHVGQFYWWGKPEYREKINRPVTSHWQTLSHNVVLCAPRLSGIRNHYISGDRHWLHR